MITSISEQFLFREEYFVSKIGVQRSQKLPHPVWLFSDAPLWLQGYVEAAQIFERESGTSPGFNLSTITDRTDIRKAVQSGELESAIERVNDLNPEVGQADFHPPPNKILRLMSPFIKQVVVDKQHNSNNTIFLRNLETRSKPKSR